MAEIKRIKYPAPVTINDDEQYTFENFIIWTLSTNSRYNNDADSIRASCRLERRIETHKDFCLDEADWKRLKDAVEHPHGGYPLRPGSRLITFVDAVCLANQEAAKEDEVSLTNSKQ